MIRCCRKIIWQYKWVIDQVSGQDGWTLAKFFLCVFMDRDEVEVHKPEPEQAWSIKDLFYGFRGNCSCGTQRVVPSGQDSSNLPSQVANHSAGYNKLYYFPPLLPTLPVLMRPFSSISEKEDFNAPQKAPLL